ncbi:LysM peptidoglycan-binding domain-containing protein [Streptococcus danieliae]|uniref:LysM peptidoglycan-binding domain-containing protein n=1 Tax=Streptococcus danieliae TaxID=747656 RepID=A0A7X3G6U4_9STRE|nr:LysM peptidoglycan-binding domain-containing protein [Streptococcus danieliae]MVX58171.1 LysM peptidoglycan-binding domain-containing protein [Streptococcus danieliae]
MKRKQYSLLTGLVALLMLGTVNTVSAESYTVKSGDTLSKIAAEKQTSLEKILERNNIQNPNVIQVGQVLELATGTPAADPVQTEIVASDQQDLVNEGVKEAEAPAETAQEQVAPAVTSNLSSDEQAAKEWIAQKESSGSYTAQNGIYYGRYQLTLSYLNGDLSPENQERVADEYVKNRYGSWTQAYQFWLANGWY